MSISSPSQSACFTQPDLARPVRMDSFAGAKTKLAAFHSCIALCAMLACGSSQAMSIYPVATAIGLAGESAKTLQVSSRSKETQFVQATVKRVLHPATPEEREELVSNWEGTGLVVSPPKFALPAGATRVVRIVGLMPVQSEEVYRVYFERVSLPPEQEEDDEKAKAGASISVNLIWGVLVRMVPATPRVELARFGTDGLRNNGNIRAELLKVGNCTGKDDSSCQWSDLTRNIYPGSELNLPGVTSSTPLRVKYQVEGMRGTQIEDLGPPN